MDSKQIVLIDVVSPTMRRTLEENLPQGFELVFAEADTDDKAAAAVRGAEFVLVWSSYMPAQVVEAAAGAKLIQKVGEGTDRIDVAAAARFGIPVARTSGGNSISVAEATTMLILATLRRLPQAHNSVMAGEWRKFGFRQYSYELHGKQVGVIGLGKIGRIVAGHMQGFGARVVCFDMVQISVSEQERLGVQQLPLDELLATSDVVTLHVPLLPSTHHLIGRRELSLMKPTAVLVNTCRGSVLDESALYAVLSEGRILGAALDVFEKEPPGASNRLLSLNNVVLTPHNAGGTVDSELALVRHAYSNIEKVSRGEALSASDIATLEG